MNKFLIVLGIITLVLEPIDSASGSRLSSTSSRRIIQPDSEEAERVMGILQDAPTHKGIRTTVFWIGERAKPNSGWSSNLNSAWDIRWKENFGGLDSPILRKGFYPAKFRPKQNPFYVALPFNDISNPEYLETCRILQFFSSSKSRSIKSVCKNRWIEIQYQGKKCYAQWQDVGPIYTDDYEYVFQGEEPRAHANSLAGLDISPAVRDFIGIKGNHRTHWRFVDDSEVPQGPWKKIVTRS
jgi:hypothetical protein